jgi:hypothetical protein
MDVVSLARLLFGVVVLILANAMAIQCSSVSGSQENGTSVRSSKTPVGMLPRKGCLT